MKHILIVLLAILLFGCAQISKSIVDNDKESYAALKAVALQKDISRSLRLGCRAGWGGLTVLPIPSDGNPVIIHTIEELRALVSTQSTSVMISDLQAKTKNWNIEDYNYGYALCEEAKLDIVLGLGDAATITAFVMRIISIFAQ